MPVWYASLTSIDDLSFKKIAHKRSSATIMYIQVMTVMRWCSAVGAKIYLASQHLFFSKITYERSGLYISTY